MKILLTYSIIILLIPFSTNAQEEHMVNGFSVGLTPSSFVNSWTGYQGEFSYGFLDKYEIELNAGYLRGTTQGVIYDGYRLRTTAKYYFENDIGLHKYYVGLGYLSRKTDELIYRRYNMFNNTFFEERLINRDKHVKGVYGLFGIKQIIGQSRFYYDFGAGLGLGNIEVALDNDDQRGQLVSERELFSVYSTEGDYFFPILMVHFSVGYRI